MKTREEIAIGHKLCCSMYTHADDPNYFPCIKCPYLREGKGNEECSDVLERDISEFLCHQPDIVRCKDCKHKEKDGISEGYHYCNINGLQVTDDWFCADGEPGE